MKLSLQRYRLVLVVFLLLLSCYNVTIAQPTNLFASNPPDKDSPKDVLHPANGEVLTQSDFVPVNAQNHSATRKGAPLLVDTNLGQVLGKRKDASLNVYLGIPFAEPPLGKLRFRPPRPKSPWYPSVYRALRFAPECHQSELFAGSPDESQPPRDEDCLYLNIWQPVAAQKGVSPTTKHDALLPVMIWLYGGAFVHGGASRAEYDGSELARKGVVVVTFNYRVGALGFLVSTSDGLYGNYGLEDQKLAIQWVQDNIAAFGGDPQRVTLFGESAGAMSVGLHLLDQQLATQYASHRTNEPVSPSWRQQKQKQSPSQRARRTSESNAENVGGAGVQQRPIRSWDDVYAIIQQQQPRHSRTENYGPSTDPSIKPAPHKSALPVRRLFQAAIMQSNPLGYRYRSISVANFLGKAFKDLLDCEDLRCLQAESVDELLYVQDTLLAVPRSIGDFFTWGPVLTDHSYFREIRLAATSTAGATMSRGSPTMDPSDAAFDDDGGDLFVSSSASWQRRRDMRASRLSGGTEETSSPHALDYGLLGLTGQPSGGTVAASSPFGSGNAANGSPTAGGASAALFVSSPSLRGLVSNITVRQPIDTMRELHRLDLPVILGVNRHEGQVFVFTAFPTRMNKLIYQALIFSFFRQAAPQVLKLYQSYADAVAQVSIYPDYRLVLSQILSDYLFRCPTQFFATQLTGSGTAVYLYEFALRTRTPGYPCCDGLSCHTSELPYVFVRRDAIDHDFSFTLSTAPPSSEAPSSVAPSSDATESHTATSTDSPDRLDDLSEHRTTSHPPDSASDGPWWQQVGGWLRDRVTAVLVPRVTEGFPTAIPLSPQVKRTEVTSMPPSSWSSLVASPEAESVDHRVARLLSDYWTTFAKAGDPNGRAIVERPVDAPWWPRLLGELSSLQALWSMQRREHEGHLLEREAVDGEAEQVPGGLWKYLVHDDGGEHRSNGDDERDRGGLLTDDDIAGNSYSGESGAQRGKTRTWAYPTTCPSSSFFHVDRPSPAPVIRAEIDLHPQLYVSPTEPAVQPVAAPTSAPTLKVEWLRDVVQRAREVLDETDPRYQHYLSQLAAAEGDATGTFGDVFFAPASDTDRTGDEAGPRLKSTTQRKTAVRSHGIATLSAQRGSLSPTTSESDFAGQRFMHQMVFDESSAVFIIENDCVCSVWNRLEYRF
jgi:carboxylesterase type B